ncbi:MAG: F0F1 ATP synthase subunit A [Spirulinaceae cyanobacterium]
MEGLSISPDNIIFYQWQWFKLNATLVYTWLVMAILVIGSWLVTRNPKIDPQEISPWQNRLEIIIEQINEEINNSIGLDAIQFLPFLGTILLFFALCNILTIFPYYESPAGSLSTTAAVAICVFVAVPYFGIKNSGLRNYLKTYIEPSPAVLPFNLLSEFTRTLSLAVRMFGNVMSTSLLVAIIVSLIPWFLPIVMRAFGLLIGVIQAYVFAVLALVYIASGIRVQQQNQRRTQHQNEQGE